MQRCAGRIGPGWGTSIPIALAHVKIRGMATTRAAGSTVVFFPEGAYGPTNNCAGIGQILRERGHRVVFVLEESFAGSLEAQGFEERLMRLGPPPEIGRASCRERV